MLLGNGNGTFQPAEAFPAGINPVNLVVGDFNGDGRPDIAVVDEGDATDPASVSLLLGNGDGTFQPPETILQQMGLFTIAAGDFTGDGLLDLAIAGSQSIYILLGNGNGSFQQPRIIPVNGPLGPMATGEFTSDGRSDLAVGSLNGVAVFQSNGDGTFQPPKEYAATGADQGLAVGDSSGDGRLDIATVGEVLPGNGDGTFQPAQASAVSAEPEGEVTGDFNGDGRTDLAAVDGVSGSIVVSLSNAQGTFTPASPVATTPQFTPLVADANGDGTDDVLLVNSAGNILYRQGIPGQPGSFEPPVTVNPGFPSLDIAWVPKTVAGPLLASVDAHDNAVSLYAFRDGAFVRVGSLPTGQFPAQVISADLDNSGWDDLIVRNAGDGTLSIFFNSGPGRFGTSAERRVCPAGDRECRPRRLRCPGRGDRRRRPLRPRGHQRADRSGQRHAQPGERGVRPAGGISRRDRIIDG